jgi:hypothetical protein
MSTAHPHSHVDGATSGIPSFFARIQIGRNSQTNHADVESHPINGLMKPHIDRVEFAHGFRIFAGNLHAKRIESLANGALGVMTSASLAVSIIGHSLAQARGLID